jgi:uncharacterized protein YqgC (DUF456 family)
MEVLLLGAVILLALVMIPLGLPGTWIIAAAAATYRILLPNGGVGWFTVACVTILAIIGAAADLALAGKYARKYGGSRRAGWGAVIGGLVGAFIGIPVPIIGPVLGAFAGAFIGALALELTAGTTGGDATRVATGALLGRVIGAAINVAIGLMMGAWVLGVAFMG